jgi:predicted 3-demethylubiquinone-9 3-methyltransferase (glyoxalase superfamily)
VLGVELAAMDSNAPHAFHFDADVSLCVRCDDQAEVDRVWTAFSEGGKPGRCGWLTDRFGVCWHIVPARMIALTQQGDAAAQGRFWAALLGMGRIDLAALERAHAGL